MLRRFWTRGSRVFERLRRSEEDRRPWRFRAARNPTTTPVPAQIAEDRSAVDNNADITKEKNGKQPNADDPIIEAGSSVDPFDLVTSEVVNSMDFTALEELASSYNDGMACQVLSDTSNGVYNMIFFLEFEDETQWVARIAARSTSRRPLDDPLSQEAMLSMIATMTYVDENTGIPVPQIYGYHVGCDNPLGRPYLFMSRLPGVQLSRLDDKTIWQNPEKPLKQIIEQWGSIVAELATCQFEAIGSLHRNEADSGYEVRQWISFSNVAVRKDHDERISRGPFTSAADYLLSQSTTERYLGVSELPDFERNLEISLNESLLPYFLDQKYLNGPFVLSHIDLDTYNILVDPKTYTITGIIDWDFASIVPVQSLFTRPRFLNAQILNLEEFDDVGADQYEAFKTFATLYEKDWEDSIVNTAKELGLEMDVTALLERGKWFGLFEKVVSSWRFQKYAQVLWKHVYGPNSAPYEIVKKRMSTTDWAREMATRWNVEVEEVGESVTEEVAASEAEPQEAQKKRFQFAMRWARRGSENNDGAAKRKTRRLKKMAKTVEKAGKSKERKWTWPELEVRASHAPKRQILINIDRDNARNHAALAGPPDRSESIQKSAEEEIVTKRIGDRYSAKQRVYCPAKSPGPSWFAPLEARLKADNADIALLKEGIAGGIDGENGRADAAKFDDSVIEVGAIVDLATRIRGIECRIFREPHTEGFCWIGFLQFVDKIEWTVRLPKPRLSDSDKTYNSATFRERCATMVAALECVGTRTTLPVPRIHDFDLSSTNILNRPYILMDCLPGQPFGSVLEGLKDHQIRSIIRQWAEYTMELAKLQFTEIGSLYKKGDGEFFVGALLPKYDSSPAGIGPFKSVADYILLSSSNKKRSDPKPPPKAYGGILRASLIDSLFPFIILPEFLNDPFILSHRTLDIDSILVDDDGRLTGILGWQNAAVVPLQSHIRVPDSLNLEFLPPSDTNASPTHVIFAKRYRRHFERAMAEASDNQWDIPDLTDRSLMYGLFEKAVLDAENEKYLPALWDHIFGKEEQAETMRAAMKKGAWGIAMGSARIVRPVGEP